MIANLQAHYGFTKMPFTASVPAPALFASAARKEAVARLRWLISAIGNPRYQNLLNARRETCAA
jgi:type II secretory pathway predicted ATPase ExeA